MLPPPGAEPGGFQVDIGGEAIGGSSCFGVGDAVGAPTISIEGTDRADHASQLFSMGG